MRRTTPSAKPADFEGAARVVFFGGKGGVGKTTCAAAEAVRRAEAGARVLVVSTDPAHSLGDALGAKLGAAPRRVRTARGALWAAELDADRALSRWLGARERALRTIASRGTYLDDDDIDALMRLSLPGVDELVGLVELRRLARARPYDAVVVDTAPTGHTLRLLAMPASLRRIAEVLDDMQAKHRMIAESLRGVYRGDAADAVIAAMAEEADDVAAELRDPARTSFVWVLLPEPMALAEARDGLAGLASLGIAPSALLVNRIGAWIARARGCQRCAARNAMEHDVVREMSKWAKKTPLRANLATPAEPRGLPALRKLQSTPIPTPLPTPTPTPTRSPIPTRTRIPAPTSWLDAIAPEGRRLILVGGKGGVGKTTTAATIALALAARGARTLLLSTDPAHSLGDVFGAPIGDRERAVPGGPARLRVRELDAGRAFDERRERYRQGVDALFARVLRGGFDAPYDRAVALDLIDLAPPGMDELFAVLALTSALLADRPAYDAVVVDTAPTGHTLRLLAMPDKALAWVHTILAILLKYREIVGLGDMARDLMDAARELRALGELVRDPARAVFVPVARAQAVVRVETERLVRALRRMRVPVGPLVVGAATTAARTAEPPCAACARRATAERREIRALGETARAMLLSPATWPPPRGARALRAWGATWNEG